MPTIEKIGHQRRYQKQKEYAIVPNNHRAFIEKIYNSQRWRAMREAYLRTQPLCEICLQEGKITAGEEVHHKHFISLGATEQDMLEIAFDMGNLQTLCKYHHHLIHANDRAEKWRIKKENKE